MGIVQEGSIHVVLIAIKLKGSKMTNHVVNFLSSSFVLCHQIVWMDLLSLPILLSAVVHIVNALIVTD